MENSKYYVTIERADYAIFEMTPTVDEDIDAFLVTINEKNLEHSCDPDNEEPLIFVGQHMVNPGEGLDVYLVDKNVVDNPDGTFKNVFNGEMYEGVVNGPNSTFVGIIA